MYLKKGYYINESLSKGRSSLFTCELVLVRLVLVSAQFLNGLGTEVFGANVIGN
jgi:hypothetical protein